MFEINRYKLSNGLRVVHTQIPNMRTAAVNILYGVGAKHEEEDKTGLAHLLEHLMFTGSANCSDYSTAVQKAAGECNAWTNNDVTNYYLTVPASNIETAFRLEADRMTNLNLAQESINTQKDVVCEEFKQRVCNVPYGDVAHILRPLCYERHHYKWPTIGKDLDSIRKLTGDDVRAFYHKHYTPGNAILSVVGNLTFDKVAGMAEKHFGQIEGNDIAPSSQAVAEERQQHLKHTEVERNVPVDMIFMAFHMCERANSDFYAFDIISDILSNGESSRMACNLVKKGKIFSSINAYVEGNIDPGLFHIDAKINQGISFETAEAKIWEEINNLTLTQISSKELDKVKNKFESNLRLSLMNNLNLAYNLAFNEMLGDAGRVNNEISLYRNTTIDTIETAITRTLVPGNANILRYKSQTA